METSNSRNLYSFALILVILCLIFTVFVRILTGRGRRVPLLDPVLSKWPLPTALDSTDSDDFGVTKEPEFSDGWYTSPDLFELEKRAIFSKSWLLLTHISHFAKPGDYLAFNVASYPIFLILGKDRVLRGFHNVCRHRAYTVTRKTAGSSLVLGCKYHGWAYDTKGALLKAPHFDDVPGFDKASNGLFEIGVETDERGLVWVCLQGGEADEQKNALPDVAIQRLTSQSTSLLTCESEAEVNWKFDVAEGDVVLACNQVSRNPYSRIAGLRHGISFWSSNRSLDYPVEVFPNAAIQDISNTSLSLLFTIYPISSTRSLFRIEVLSSLKRSNVPSHEAHQLEQIRTQFEQQVKAVEARFKASSATARSMHVWQKQMLDIMHAHLKTERAAGRKIIPATPEQTQAASCSVAERLCRELEELGKPAEALNFTRANLSW